MSKWRGAIWIAVPMTAIAIAGCAVAVSNLSIPRVNEKLQPFLLSQDQYGMDRIRLEQIDSNKRQWFPNAENMPTFAQMVDKRVVPPRLLGAKKLLPDYPNGEQGKEVGEVDIAILINETGRVFEAKVIRSTNEKLHFHALRAAREMYFSPATMNGMEIKYVLVIPYNYAG